MKNTPVILVILIAIAIIAMVACSGDNGDTYDVTGQYVDDRQIPELTLPERISLDGLTNELPNIDNLVVVDNTIYFTSRDAKYDGSMFYITRLFSANLDGTDLTVLSNHSLPEETPYDADGGRHWITALRHCQSGNLWIVEVGDFFTIDLPPGFDAENADYDDILYYREELSRFTAVRKLDTSGAELLSLDLTLLAESPGFFGISALNVDYDNNIYIGYGDTLFILDIDGNISFQLNSDSGIHRLVRLYNGSVAHFGWHDRSGLSLTAIDTHNRTWGADIALPSGVRNVFPGNDTFTLLFHDESSLSGVDSQTGETVQLVPMLAVGITPASVRDVIPLPNERFLVALSSQDIFGGRSIESIRILSKITPEILDERTVLTLAVLLPMHSTQVAVTQFNATSTTHVVEIIQLTTAESPTVQDGVDRLILDVMAGNSPDIIDVGGVPSLYYRYRFAQLAGRGLFKDLYPLIDADPVLSRDDFIQSVLEASEKNGRLYEASSTFMIRTIIGSSEILGSSGWSIEDLMAVIEENPQAEFPLGPFINRSGFLRHIALQLGINDFVDWESYTVNFDTDNFIRLLEFVYNTFPNEVEIITDEAGNIIMGEAALIQSGSTIMTPRHFMFLEEYSLFRALYGGDFVFKGFPRADGGGSFIETTTSFAISSASDHPDAAWEFVRTFLTPEWQGSPGNFGLPTRIDAFENAIDQASLEREGFQLIFGESNFPVTPLTPRRIERIRTLLESAISDANIYQNYRLLEMVLESAEDYWNGLISVQDAARIIQSRASIYVAERQR